MHSRYYCKVNENVSFQIIFIEIKLKICTSLIVNIILSSYGLFGYELLHMKRFFNKHNKAVSGSVAGHI